MKLPKIKKQIIQMDDMKSKTANAKPIIKIKKLAKSPTGIEGFDDISFGGLPQGKTTLVGGNAGSGKTLFGMQFLVHGALENKEPGVFMSFQETEKELIENFASLNFNLQKLVTDKLLVFDFVQFEHSEMLETGSYDLEALIIRLNYAIENIGAKRLVIDTIESLFSGLPNPNIIRGELRRLFSWLKEKGVTTIITGERINELNTSRQGFEEYLTDCVIQLDNRVSEQATTRRLRILKYRGSIHGTNEYPFLIEDKGISIVPITTIKLNYKVSNERISSGIPRLDTMLGGKGFYEGSGILVSGTSGSGKSSIASYFVNARCEKNEKVLYFTLEESDFQIKRNLLSIGIDLEKWEKKGLLKFHCNRPSFCGAETYLMDMYEAVNSFNPSIVIIDPISSFILNNDTLEAKAMVIRMIDFLKTKKITSFLTYLSHINGDTEHTQLRISSMIDTWILLRDIEANGERNRGIYVLKSRGMEHSNQIREFKLTEKGLVISDVFIGETGVVMGTTRLIEEQKAKTAALIISKEIIKKELMIAQKEKALQAKIAEIKAAFEVEISMLNQEIKNIKETKLQFNINNIERGASRKTEPAKTTPKKVK